MTMSTSKSPEDATLECTAEQLRALGLIKNSKRFLLTGHVRPDGDCVGAQAALASCLERMGAEVSIINPDPIESRFEYLARHVPFKAWEGEELPPHDVVVFLDFNELSRCGRLGEAFARANSKKLVIDHHISVDEPWWDESFVDVRASATGLLIHRIHEAIGLDIDLAAAEGIFTSIVVDSPSLLPMRSRSVPPKAAAANPTSRSSSMSWPLLGDVLGPAPAPKSKSELKSPKPLEPRRRPPKTPPKMSSKVSGATFDQPPWGPESGCP